MYPFFAGQPHCPFLEEVQEASANIDTNATSIEILNSFCIV